ncbi:MAG: hypothetical protein WBA28_01410, partial [Microbacteriaceae bacterium]
MNLLDLVFQKKSDAPVIAENQALVLLAQSVDGKPFLVDPQEQYSEFALLLSALKFSGAKEELNSFWSETRGHQVSVIGIGEEVSINALREVAGSASRRLTGFSTLVFDFAPESAEAQA